MDKRILILIACFWSISIAVFCYKKVYSAGKLPSPQYIVSIENNTAHTGESILFKDNTEEATGWKWDFGDGEYSLEKNPTHIYLDPGTYPVRLTVYGSFGYVTNENKSINVLSAGPAPPATPQPAVVPPSVPPVSTRLPGKKPHHRNPRERHIDNDEPIQLPSAQPFKK